MKELSPAATSNLHHTYNNFPVTVGLGPHELKLRTREKGRKKTLKSGKGKLNGLENINEFGSFQRYRHGPAQIRI